MEEESTKVHQAHPSPFRFPRSHLVLLLELASNALRDKRHILAAVRGLTQGVARVEGTCSPAGPAKVDIRVGVQLSKLLAHILETAAVRWPAASLGQDSLALVRAEPVTKGLEDLDVVGGAGGVGARVVGVEVLVDVEDEVGGAAVEVGDLHERGAGAVGDEGTGGSVVVTREQDLVASGAGLADGGHGGLDRGGPLVDVDVVRLVHDAERNLGVRLVLGGDLAPEGSELSIGRSTLTNDRTVVAGVVVDVDDAHGCTRVQASLNQLVVVLEVAVQGAADAVDDVLPADWETECVEAVILNEVVHLSGANADRVGDLIGASSRGVTAEVEAGNVDLRCISTRGQRSQRAREKGLTPAYWT